MKITKKMMVGILALALVLTFAGCGGDDGDGGGGGSGSNLSISGQQVYETNGILTTEYNGDLPVNSNVGGNGSITEGKLTFSVGRPNTLSPLESVMTSGEFGNIFSYFEFSPNGTQGIVLSLTTGAGDLSKVNRSVNTSMAVSVDMIYYAYVDRDCTITGEGRTASISGYTVTYPNTTLNLKTGWNAIAVKVVLTSISSKTGTASFSVGDSSSCKWTLDFSF